MKQKTQISFIDKLKMVSSAIYGLSLVTFFMQLGSTFVHGGGNSVLSGKLLNPTIFIFVRSFSESISVFFKIFAGWLSDRIKNRTIFLVIGYGSALVFKICFFISTLNMNLEFLSWMFIIVHVIDRCSNAIRDPTKEAFVTDNTSDEIRSISFGIRKSVGSMGTVLGGVIAFIILKTKFLTGSQLFFTAIFPVLASSIILFFMFTKKNQSAKNLSEKINFAIGFFVLFSVLLLGNSYLTKIAMLILCAVIPNIFRKFTKSQALIPLLSSFFTFIFSFFIMKSSFFSFGNMWYETLFKSIEIAGFFSCINAFFVNLFHKSSKADFFDANLLKYLLIFPFIFINFNSFDLSMLRKYQQILIPIFGPNLFFDSLIPKFLIFQLNEKKSYFSSLFYIIFFSSFKFFLLKMFPHQNIELSNAVFSFFSLLITFVSIVSLNFLKKYIKNLFVFLLYFSISILMIFITTKVLNLPGELPLIVGKFYSRIFISKSILERNQDISPLNVIMKNLPFDIISVILYYNKFTILFLIIIEIASNYNFLKISNKETDDSFMSIASMNKNVLMILVVDNLIISIRMIDKILEVLLKRYNAGLVQNTLTLFVFSLLSGFIMFIFQKMHNESKNSTFYTFFLSMLLLNNFSNALICTAFFIVYPPVQKIASYLMEKIQPSFLNIIAILFFMFTVNYVGYLMEILLGISNLGSLIETLFAIGFIGFAMKHIKGIFSVFLMGSYAIASYYFHWSFAGYQLAALFLCIVLFLLAFRKKICKFTKEAMLLIPFIGLNVPIVLLFFLFDYLIQFEDHFIERVQNKIKEISSDKSVNINLFVKIVSIASIMSFGKLNESVYFERFIKFGYGPESSPLVLGSIFLFMSISSILMNFFDRRKFNLKIIAVFCVFLILANLLMGGFIPFIGEKISLFLSLVFYGAYAGSSDIFISTAISRTTEQKHKTGTLFGVYYFFTGIFSMLLTFISFYLISKFGCATCGLFASIPPAMVLLSLFFLRKI